MKAILTIIFLSFTPLLKAPEARTISIRAELPLRDESLLKAIIQVESRGNPSVINWKENAIGLLQIRPVMLKEVNRIIGYEKYNLKDCFDSVKSIEIFWIVQNYWNPENNFYRGSKVWNGYGKTDKYWQKIKARLSN